MKFRSSLAKYDWWNLTQRDLAAALKRVIANETEYLSYFWWKDFYRNVNFHPYAGKLCDYQIMKTMLSYTEWRPTWSSTHSVSCARCSMIPMSQLKSGTIWRPGGRLEATARWRALTLGPSTGKVLISRTCEYQFCRSDYEAKVSESLSVNFSQFTWTVIPFQTVAICRQLACEIDTGRRQYLKQWPRPSTPPRLKKWFRWSVTNMWESSENRLP